MVLDADFPIALRGYERSAVDAYVRRVSRVIQELEASRSPQSAIRYALEQVSEQTRAILQQAHDSADAVTSKSRVEADDRLQRAESEAVALKVSAEQRLRDLEDEVAALWQERDRLLAEMRDVSLRMHDVVVTAAERQPRPPLDIEDDQTEAIEPADGASEGWIEDADFDDDQPSGRPLVAVPPPPSDPEPEPSLVNAPPPAPEEAAGPLAFEDELPLDALDAEDAPIAEEDDAPPHPLDEDRPEPFGEPPEWDEPEDDPLILELSAEPAEGDDAEGQDPAADRGDREPPQGDPLSPDDHDTADREPPR